MTREADIINTIKDIKKEAELITVLKDIKTELAGIRMELENLRESNIELKLEPEENHFWRRTYFPTADETVFRCTKCDHQCHFNGNVIAPNLGSCPNCNTKMSGVW